MAIEMTDEIRRRFERVAECKRMYVDVVIGAIDKEIEAERHWRRTVYDPNDEIHPDKDDPTYHDRKMRKARAEKIGEDWEKYKKEHYPYGFDENGPII